MKPFDLLLIFLLTCALTCFAAPRETLILEKEWSSAGEEKIELPVDICLDSKGRILVLDQGRVPKIHVYETDGRFIKSLALEKSQLPAGMALDSTDNIFVSDLNRDVVLKYSPVGDLLAVIGGYGESRERFDNPRGIVIDRQDNMYVADSGNSRIVKYDSKGKPDFIIRIKDKRFPAMDLAFTPDGLLVAILGNHPAHPVVLWNSEGVYQREDHFWSRLPKPLGIWVDPAGNFYFSCFYSVIVEGRVLAKKDSLSIRNVYGDSGKLPRQVFCAIVGEPNGDVVYAVDKYGAKIIKFRRQNSERKQEKRHDF